MGNRGKGEKGRRTALEPLVFFGYPSGPEMREMSGTIEMSFVREGCEGAMGFFRVLGFCARN